MKKTLIIVCCCLVISIYINISSIQEVRRLSKCCGQIIDAWERSSKYFQEKLNEK